MRLVEFDDGPMVQVCWKGLPETEDTLETIAKIYKDVSQLLLEMPRRKTTPSKMFSKARRTLFLEDGKCDDLQHLPCRSFLIERLFVSFDCTVS